MPTTRKRKAPSEETSKPIDSSASKKRRSQRHSKPSSAVAGEPNSNDQIQGTEIDAHFCKTFTIPTENDKVIRCQLYGPNPKSSSAVKYVLIFTHGAGGGIEDSAMKLFAEGYAMAGMPVLCFQGTMNLKNRTKSFETVLEYCKKEYPNCEFVVGGRSMGARAAVMLAGEHEEVQKIIAASYPLVSPKGDVRDEILIDLVKGKKICFLSGDRDTMCDLERLEEVREKMSAASKVMVIKNTDHGTSLVGKVKDKAKAIEEIRRKSGQIAAQWVGGEHDDNGQTTELRWDEENGKPVVESKGIQEDGSHEEDEAHDHEAEHSAVEEKAVAKKRGRASNTNPKTQSGGKARNLRTGSRKKKG